jgi:putative toxin-antitoxin system antitoxin component (TIGR02293 family)
MNALEISDQDFLTGARIGIQKSKLLSIAHETGLTLKELSSYLRISTRSIQDKEATQLIAPGPSERALYIARLFKSGNDLFGNMDKFHNWLNMENLAMGGEKPVSYLDTFSGIQFVMDELNAIEYGFPA